MIDGKQLENVQYLKYLGRITTNDARCPQEIKSEIALAKAAFNKTKTRFTGKLDSGLRKKLAFWGAETWTLRKVVEKYLESFKIWW